MPQKNNVFTRGSGIGGGKRGKRKVIYILLYIFYFLKPKEYILPLLPPIFKKVSKYKALRAISHPSFLPPQLPPDCPLLPPSYIWGNGSVCCSFSSTWIKSFFSSIPTKYMIPLTFTSSNPFSRRFEKNIFFL